MRWPTSLGSQVARELDTTLSGYNFEWGHKMTELIAWADHHAGFVQLAATIVSSMVTLIAVLVAWKTASSTSLTVSEMREARLQAVRPVLYLHSPNTNIRIKWLREEASTPSIMVKDEPVYKSPIFELRNTVESPAFDIKVDWTIEEHDGLSGDYRLATFQHSAASRKDSVKFKPKSIEVFDPTDTDSFMNSDYEFGNEGKTSHFELLGGSAKEINMPRNIANYIMFSAIVRLERQQIYNEYMNSISKILTAIVSCSTPSGETISRKFRFRCGAGYGSFTDSDGKMIAAGTLPADWKKMEIFLSISSVTTEEVKKSKDGGVPSYLVDLGRKIFTFSTNRNS